MSEPRNEPVDAQASVDEHHDVSEHDVLERADLLPEERAAGSDDPHAQAEAILEESAERTEHPDPDASTQSQRRSSDESV